ncbi:hypothetical protein MAIT1_02287 [Magnetofaba australis IT-1]|uniref:protein O-GlcNAc transferase n=2 Tax=Magnetofaba TaxID=1472292 RepID=A0A1Y2K4Y5_9PROT|nr:hypothetical protein MAIT1_02287 [Magnetofaba australis IT-1]
MLFEQACAADPTHAPSWYGAALCRQTLGDWGGAISGYQQALARNSDDPDTWNNLGVALQAIGNLEVAEQALRMAVKLSGGRPALLGNLAGALRVQGRFEGALAALREALAAQPDNLELHANLIFTLDQSPGIPFAELLAERRAFNARFVEPLKPVWTSPAKRVSDSAGPLRIGYVSADFRRHSAAWLFGPILWNHDPQRVQWVGYANQTQSDDLTARFRAAASGWREILGGDDATVAQWVREDRIDLLVDLSGYSAGNRLGVFAQRPAPWQASGWGYGVGMGLDCYDLIFSGPGIFTREEIQALPERVVTLPAPFVYTPPERTPPPSVVAPRGINGHLTYGAFTRGEKISDATLAWWGEVLRREPSARLLIKGPNLNPEANGERVLSGLQSVGVEPERVRILPATDQMAHLAAHQRLDALLDTLPMNGGTSTCEALYMGVPVITRSGATPAGRTGAALLTALNAPDGLRGAALRQHFLASPLGDVAASVRAYEESLTAIITV